MFLVTFFFNTGVLWFLVMGICASVEKCIDVYVGNGSYLCLKISWCSLKLQAVCTVTPIGGRTGRIRGKVCVVWVIRYVCNVCRLGGKEPSAVSNRFSTFSLHFRDLALRQIQAFLKSHAGVRKRMVARKYFILLGSASSQNFNLFYGKELLKMIHRKFK